MRSCGSHAQFVRSIETAASSFGVQAIAAPLHTESDIKSAIEGFKGEPKAGLLFPTDTFTTVHAETVLDLATKYRLPTLFSEEQGVRKGGLLFYGVQFLSQFQQAAVYADRILKGAKPSDLPIQLPTDFKFIINMTTARTLGIDVPMGLMLRADEMIE